MKRRLPVGELLAYWQRDECSPLTREGFERVLSADTLIDYLESRPELDPDQRDAWVALIKAFHLPPLPGPPLKRYPYDDETREQAQRALDWTYDLYAEYREEHDAKGALARTKNAVERRYPTLAGALVGAVKSGHRTLR